MRPLAPRAQAQFDALVAHFERLDRDRAIANLANALRAVSHKIEASNGVGLAAPASYPEVAGLGLGFRWLRSGNYWFAFTPPPDMIITGVFYDRSDIPTRL